MPAEVNATLLHTPGQCSDGNQQAGEIYSLLIVPRELNNLSIAFEKRGKHSIRECFAIVHLEVPQVVEGIPAPDLAKVDDTGIVALFLIDVRRVKIPMCKPGLLHLQP